MGQWSTPEFIDSAAHGPCKFAQGPGGQEWVGYIDKRSDPPMLRIRYLPDSSYYDVDSVGVGAWSDDIALVMSAGLPHAFYVRRNLWDPTSGTIFHAKFTGRQWLMEAVDALHNEYGTLLAAHSSGDTLWVIYHQQWPVGTTFVVLVQATKIGGGPWTYDTVISSTSDHFEPIATIGSEVMFYHFVGGEFKNHPTPGDHPLWSQNLCLARKEGQLWIMDTMNVGVDLVSAVYDAANEWFVVFRDEGWWNLTLMKGTFGRWETSVLDTGRVISSSKIDVWQGRPYILSAEPREGGANAPPWFLVFRGSSGQVEIVDSCEQVCSHGMSIRVLPDGRVAVIAALWRRSGRCNEVRYSVREALGIKEQGNLVTRAGRAATIVRQQFGRPAHDIKFFDVTGRLVQPTRPGIYHCPGQKGRVVIVR